MHLSMMQLDLEPPTTKLGCWSWSKLKKNFAQLINANLNKIAFLKILRKVSLLLQMVSTGNPGQRGFSPILSSLPMFIPGGV
ncbi:MAG: hypothetical protein CM1200mP16_14580 [Nitrospina sp.]|nr:MAG: hypothetical protein CM1200mP16_14580 [Nitrospina sp.]